MRPLPPYGSSALVSQCTGKGYWAWTGEARNLGLSMPSGIAPSRQGLLGLDR